MNNRTRLSLDKVGKSWRSLTDDLGIRNVSYVYNYVVHGIEPTNKTIRKKLGITNEAAIYRRNRRAELKEKFLAAGWSSQYEFLDHVLKGLAEIPNK